MEIKKLVRAALFTAIIAVSALISIPFFGVPFTLQVMALFLSCLLQPFKYALLSVICYLVLGIAGLPVFSGGRAGLGIILGPTGGFLIGFLLFPFFISLLKKKILGMSISIVLLYIIGILWLSYFAKLSYANAFKAVMLFIPMDFIKMFLSYMIYKKIDRNI